MAKAVSVFKYSTNGYDIIKVMPGQVVPQNCPEHILKWGLETKALYTSEAPEGSEAKEGDDEPKGADRPVTSIKGIGASTAEELAGVDVNTVREFLDLCETKDGMAVIIEACDRITDANLAEILDSASDLAKE